MRLEHSGGAVVSSLTNNLGGATGDLTIYCNALTNWPTGAVGNFVVTINRGGINEERILCSSRTGNTLTVWSSGGSTGRAWDGTTIAAHVATESVEHTFSGVEADDANEHSEASTGVHGVTGALVGTSGAQTLADKTLTAPVLTAPVIADFTSAAHDHGDADDGGVLPAASVLNRPINPQTGTTYSFALADARKHVTGANASPSTFTLPLQATVTWLDDAAIPITNLGAGVLTLAIAGGGTLNGATLTLAQGESAVLLRTASDVWWCLPFSSGSGFTWAVVGSTTGSPATGTGKDSQPLTTWTANGTVTFSTAGWIRVVCAGGGRGGSGGTSLAGGGGQVVDCMIYVAAATYNIVVGAAGLYASSSGGVSSLIRSGEIVRAVGSDGFAPATNWNVGLAGYSTNSTGLLTDISGASVGYGGAGWSTVNTADYDSAYGGAMQSVTLARANSGGGGNEVGTGHGAAGIVQILSA